MLRSNAYQMMCAGMFAAALSYYSANLERTQMSVNNMKINGGISIVWASTDQRMNSL